MQQVFATSIYNIRDVVLQSCIVVFPVNGDRAIGIPAVQSQIAASDPALLTPSRVSRFLN